MACLNPYPQREKGHMQSICPNCEKHDEIYVRSGGRLVCRECAEKKR